MGPSYLRVSHKLSRRNKILDGPRRISMDRKEINQLPVSPKLKKSQFMRLEI